MKVKEHNEKNGTAIKMKTKLMRIGTATKLSTHNRDIDIIDNVILLGSTINSKGTSSQEIYCSLILEGV